MSDREEGGAAVGEAAVVRPAEEVADALVELFNHIRAHFERIVQPYELPAPCAKALRLIDGSISMKELGSRIHCDGSFITFIADTLEERGLARREIDQNDRRIKNLVLTRRGMELRSRLVQELFDDFPGVRNLDARERESLLALLRKMVAAENELGGPAEGGPGCAA
jgi:MarR family transcriptional regulator, organic hydroperoxide resistance regulator